MDWLLWSCWLLDYIGPSGDKIRLEGRNRVSLAPFTLPFDCKDPAPILPNLLSVTVSDGHWCLSSCLSCQLFFTFLPEKTVSVPDRKILTYQVSVSFHFCVVVVTVVTVMDSPPDQDFSEPSPENSPPPRGRWSQTAFCWLIAVA